jgi:Na+-driven multidrug efflux pump
MAMTPLRLLVLTLPLDAAGLVFFQALNGAGDTRTVLFIAGSLQWFVLLPAVYVVGPLLGLGLLSVWIAYCGYRLLHAAVFVWVWQRGKWTDIPV